MKLLIVDDPVSQKLLEEIVRREGYGTVLVNKKLIETVIQKKIMS